MKVCGICYQEFDGEDGRNLCPSCDSIESKRDGHNATARQRRKELKEVYESLGLKKVRGALGRTYWE